MEYEITSPTNERIKRLVRLKDRRHRDAEGVFVVEGPRLVERAIEAGMQPVEVYADAPTSFGSSKTTTVAPTALDRASYRNRSQGVIAVFEQFGCDLDGIRFGPDALLLAAEGIEKPGNLGAMLRTADAVGADGFIAIGEDADVFNPNTLRSSTGSVFTVPVAVTGLDQLLTRLAVPLVAASPDAEVLLWDADLRNGVALMVGAEAGGLSFEATQHASQLVAVPMHGAADSLNASVTLALLAYEAVRQRRE